MPRTIEDGSLDGSSVGVEVLGTDPERAWADSLGYRHEIHGAVRYWLRPAGSETSEVDPVDVVAEIYRRHGADIDAGRLALDQRAALGELTRRLFDDRFGLTVDPATVTPVIELPEHPGFQPATYRSVPKMTGSARPRLAVAALVALGVGLGGWLVFDGGGSNEDHADTSLNDTALNDTALDETALDETATARSDGDRQSSSGAGDDLAESNDPRLDKMLITEGVLADGVAFSVERLGRTPEPVTAAVVMVGQAVTDGVVEPTHVVSFALTGSGHPLSPDVVGSGPGLDWRVRVDPLDPREPLFGSAKIDFINELQPSIERGMPILNPAGSYVIVPESSLVRFETFAVRSGCPTLRDRAVCSPTNSAHVETTTLQDQTSIESGGNLLPTDGSWYDQGP